MSLKAMALVEIFRPIFFVRFLQELVGLPLKVKGENFHALYIDGAIPNKWNDGVLVR